MLSYKLRRFASYLSNLNLKLKFIHPKVSLSTLQVVQGVILGGPAEESATVLTMDIAIACMGAACALLDFMAASATCVSTHLTLI